MKKYFFLIFVLVSSVHAKTFEYGDYITNVSGFVNYTYSTNSTIVPQNEYSAVINTTISNQIGYISGQFSNNKFNPIRRLLVNVPVYVNGCNELDLSFGRLTNSIGFINTNLRNSQVNGSVLFPLSTYDPRRYTNFPDITDGGQISYSANLSHINIKIKSYLGKQVLDDPKIDVYGSHFSLYGKSDIMYGFDIKAVYENKTTFHYNFTDNTGTATYTDPRYFINIIDKNLTQQIHFLGVEHYIDDVKIQGEATFRKLNTVSSVFGGNVSASYNFTGKWDFYTGVSYGVRTNGTSRMVDVYAGISDTIQDVTMTLELHRAKLDNWFFEFDQPEHKTLPIALFSVTYSF
jgi:hypothetical protein